MLEIIAVGVTRLEIMHVRLVMMCLSTAIDKKVLEVDDESIPCFVRSCVLAVFRVRLGVMDTCL